MYTSTYLGREATDIELEAFDLEDERSLVDDEEGEIVEDPSVFIDTLKRLQTYFRNTACPEEVC